MDESRPSLDLRFFADICPDKNGMSILNQSFMNCFDICDLSSPSYSGFHKI